MKRKGFTLVELLVVIAIIALLISILAPSLSLVKDIAKQMICGTNLHGVGMANSMYAADNKGQVPPFTQPKGTQLGAMAYRVGGGGSWPYLLHQMYRSGPTGSDAPIEPSTGKVIPNGALSLLLYYGQIEKADMVYCPAIRGNQLSRAAFPDPYGQRIDQSHLVSAAGLIKSSYGFNPDCRVDGAGNGWYNYTGVEMFPSNVILATDPLFNVAWGGSWHIVSGQTSPTWVRLYPDAHASPRTSASTYKYLKETSGSAWDQWPIFLKALSYVQD
jgi:prepilin-type N-terminal cleavage/methylation domain-containing protein